MERIHGPVGRLGRYAATHSRLVIAVWVVIAVGLGLFAPRAEKALSGAGWEATGSESVHARDLIDANFDGLSSYGLAVVVHSPASSFGDRDFDRTVAEVESALVRDPAVRTVVAPRRGESISADGHTAIVRAGAADDSNAMVAAADRLADPLAGLANGDVSVALTGAAGSWADFNESNKEAMLRSEVISWPITLAIMLLAFGSLVAAGLPLMLTIAGLIAAAGSLYLSAQLLPISIWAMNFALMFALALGIDYALFIVHRFRRVRSESDVDRVEATAQTMDTAGKAVLFSGLTVLVSLSAVALVPSPAFRSTALGIALAVVFVLAATLTLLPAVLARLGPAIDRVSVPGRRPRSNRSARSAAWAQRLWRRPLAYGGLALGALVLLILPLLQLQTAMPSVKAVPADAPSRIGFEQARAGLGAGAAAPLQLVGPARAASRIAAVADTDPGIAAVSPAELGARHLALVTAIPTGDPSDPRTARTIERLRAALPPATVVGGTPAESHDLEAALSEKLPLVIGVVLGLSFVLLLVALRAPVLAAAGVLANLLATGAAFGIAKLIFQDGLLHGPLGFEPQGFVDAWAPVFFFAMIFALSMDYTVFLLSSAKEHWDRCHDPREAMVRGVGDSGGVIFAAAAVMVAVFFTFALSGPLPPKEMGVILGTAVLLDAVPVRLVLIPVLLRLAGRRAWYLPRWADRVLPRVSFGHGPAPAAGPAHGSAGVPTSGGVARPELVGMTAEPVDPGAPAQRFGGDVLLRLR